MGMTIGLEGTLDNAVEIEGGLLFATSSSFPLSLDCNDAGVMKGRSLPFRRLEGSGGGEEYRKHLGTIIVFKGGGFPQRPQHGRDAEVEGNVEVPGCRRGGVNDARRSMTGRWTSRAMRNHHGSCE